MKKIFALLKVDYRDNRDNYWWTFAIVSTFFTGLFIFFCGVCLFYPQDIKPWPVIFYGLLSIVCLRVAVFTWRKWGLMRRIESCSHDFREVTEKSLYCDKCKIHKAIAQGRDTVGITNERLMNMRQVGRVCAQAAKELFGYSQQECQQMFIMGFLHDIGYEFAKNQPDHNRVGGELLKQAGYVYAEPIISHGDPTADFSDERVLLINYADMSVDSSGKFVGFSTRLKDIASRYGSESPQYITSAKVISAVQRQLAKLAKDPILRQMQSTQGDPETTV